jgi:hypothetical protein
VKPPQPTGQFDNATGLWRPTEWWVCPISQGRHLVVRAGFLSDGISSPKIIWPWIGPYAPDTFPAGLAHDALYAAELLPRAECDAEFERLMIYCGAGYLKSRAAWLAVRGFGWAVWRRHTAHSIAKARRFAEIL